MQAAFEAAWERLKNIHVSKAGERYERETTETAGEYMELIDQLLRMKGVNTEICGSWVWCSGDTRPHRPQLKELGFRWSQNKAAWYYHREPYRKRSDRDISLDEIREMYGSRRFSREEEEQLALQGQ